ncbi:MAG: hypothetical protein J5787_01010 [Alphaproteobacteria bacterium]|nr:hypothetical protein [Alphaproteobacteria bacterium]MBO4643860.1 hypothetical protein [Alphaproteobacteria bacterium]
MKKIFLLSVALTLLTCSALSAQEVIKVKTVEAASPAEPTPRETLENFLRTEEGRVCSELRSFAGEKIFKDSDFMAAATDRNTRRVARAASKFADILAKEYDTDFVFYHPNTHFFVRVNDKGYRGRMRLPAEAAASSSACFWERLPSQDLVYSALIKIDGEKTGYLKISKKLTRMVSGMPDVLAPFGAGRIYTALDKAGLKKMAWFKMRRKETDKPRHSGWCTANNLAFLTSIGSGRVLTKKQQKKLLSLSDHKNEFVLPEVELPSGSLPLFGLDGERLGAVVYTLTPPDKKQDAVLSQEEKDDDCATEEKQENLLYRLFD